MSKKRTTDKVREQLLVAALGRKVVTTTAWDYGWSEEEYRHSDTAAMTHDRDRSVSLTPDAVVALESAVHSLLRDSNVRELYDPEEFWSLAASLLGTLPLDYDSDQLSVEIDRRLLRILEPPRSLVFCPIANVAAPDPPIVLGPLVVGRVDEAWEQLVRTKLGHRGFLPMPHAPWWLPSQRGSSHTAPVMLA